MFNREFIYDIQTINESGQQYHTNFAYSKDITQEQMNKVVEVHNTNNYYNLVTNNCVCVATEAWDAAFITSIFEAVDEGANLPDHMVDIQFSGISNAIMPRKVYSILGHINESYSINVKAWLKNKH